jgi:ABC-2 type transport system permease protein
MRFPLSLLVSVNLRQAWRRLTAIRERSAFLSAFILLFIGGYAVLAFYLFLRGLQFVSNFPGLGELMVERLLYLLFAFLFGLLLLSNLIISYTNLFRNRETAFLLSLPIDRNAIFRWKFTESTLLASWAFIFLIAPLLAAYGMSNKVPWHFYPATLLFIALFIILPSVGGAFLAVVVARLLDRRAFQAFVLFGVAFGIFATIKWLKADPITDDMLETRVLTVLDRLLAKTNFALFPMLPSYWLSNGVMHWAEGALRTAGFFVLVLLSNALFFGTLAFTRFGSFFYEAFSTVQSRGSAFARWGWFQALERRKRTTFFSVGPMDLLQRLLPFKSDVSALVVKDLRVFWRDTTQWGQTLVLLGLLAAYVVNLRHFTRQINNPFWMDLISFMNLAACALNVATLTTRFVFPQFSLEGKRLWIVGMAPLGLPNLLRIKFVLGVIGTFLVTGTLIIASSRMLKLSPEKTVYFVYAIGAMVLTMNGLAVGLGALYPNFREDNPSKIVSGFGGTFCLVLSFLYILLSVLLLGYGAPWAQNGTRPWALIILAWGLFAALCAVLGWFPLQLAKKRVVTQEY